MAPGPVWTAEKSRPHWDSIPDRPARSSVAIPTELLGNNDREKLKVFREKTVPVALCTVLSLTQTQGSQSCSHPGMSPTELKYSRKLEWSVYTRLTQLYLMVEIYLLLLHKV